MMEQITILCASQTQLKQWARLTEAKYRREDGLFLAEGVKVVHELLKSDWQTEAILVLAEKSLYWGKILAPVTNRIPVYQLKRTEWKRLSQDKEPEGVMALVRNKERPSFSSWLASADGHLLIGHDLSNPQNLGALMRSAWWFGFAGIVLGVNSVDWANPKVIRASMGGIFHLAVFPDVDLCAALPEIRHNHVLVGSDARQGVSPHPLTKKAALLLGSESHGLPDNVLEQVTERWRIPGGSQADSLSLPQAAAIMMYEMSK
jgi:RNA methyltransferase, TrmH family